MNPIIAICDFTAYPALKGEKLFLEQKLESIQQESGICTTLPPSSTIQNPGTARTRKEQTRS